jgi:hypothetical protein
VTRELRPAELPAAFVDERNPNRIWKRISATPESTQATVEMHRLAAGGRLVMHLFPEKLANQGLSAAQVRAARAGAIVGRRKGKRREGETKSEGARK